MKVDEMSWKEGVRDVEGERKNKEGFHTNDLTHSGTPPQGENGLV